jgi:hypothetical protein
MRARSSTACLTVACFILGASGAAAAPKADAAPAAGASATSAPVTALKQIGRVRARTVFCQTVLDHARITTAAALDNDSVIAETSVYLSRADLDENAMAKPKAVWDLQRSYEALMGRAHDAIDETKALRKAADDAPTPEQKAALIEYADAIGGALHRQEIVAKDYREFAVFLEANDPVSWQQHDRDLIAASVFPMLPWNRAMDPRDRVPAQLADLAKAEAVHLTDIHERVIEDEVHAGTSVDAALGPCAPDVAP